jgi:N-glycosidase YbiA
MRLRVVALSVAVVGCAGQPRATIAPTSMPATTQSAVRKIDSFQGEYRFLSNFWPAEVVFEGITYPDVEHAYQSAKTLDMNERRRIAVIATPAEAKHAGEALQYRADWEQVKIDVMEQCVRYKFTHHPELAAKLQATGDAELEEGNTWGDQIWGVYQGKGANHLGIILMKVRGELREAKQ